MKVRCDSELSFRFLYIIFIVLISFDEIFVKKFLWYVVFIWRCFFNLIIEVNTLGSKCYSFSYVNY